MTSVLVKKFVSGLALRPLILDDSVPMHKVKSMKKWLSKSDLAAQRKNLNSIQTNTQTQKATAHLHMHILTDQNISHDTLPFSHKYAHIHHSLSSLPVTHSESVILTVLGNPSFLYKMTV